MIDLSGMQHGLLGCEWNVQGLSKLSIAGNCGTSALVLVAFVCHNRMHYIVKCIDQQLLCNPLCNKLRHSEHF